MPQHSSGDTMKGEILQRASEVWEVLVQKASASQNTMRCFTEYSPSCVLSALCRDANGGFNSGAPTQFHCKKVHQQRICLDYLYTFLKKHELAIMCAVSKIQWASTYTVEPKTLSWSCRTVTCSVRVTRYFGIVKDLMSCRKRFKRICGLAESTATSYPALQTYLFFHVHPDL